MYQEHLDGKRGNNGIFPGEQIRGMIGKGTEMNGGKLSIAMAALAVLGAAFIVFAQGDGKGRDRMNRTSGASGTARLSVPAIDLEVPAKTETAIFALG